MPDLVSVIVTSYNAAPWIRAAIESILTQTHGELECVVVDDGSTDGTAALVEKLHDPRLRLLQPGRLGRGRALNLGLREARGTLIAIQDADDLSHPRRLETEVRLLREHPEVSVLGTGQRLVWDSSPVDLVRERLAPVADGRLKSVTSSLLFLNPLSHTSLMVRRHAIEAVGGYEETRGQLFDYDLLLRLAAAGYPPYAYSTPLVFKRVHARQHFERGRRLRYVSSVFRLQRAALDRSGGSRVLLVAFAGLFLYRLAPAWLRLSARHLYSRRRPARSLTPVESQ